MSDVFRKQYRELNPDQLQALKNIKERAEKLFSSFEHDDTRTLQYHVAVENPIESGSFFFIRADPRMMALAKTKLEEAVMWATKAIS